MSYRIPVLAVATFALVSPAAARFVGVGDGLRLRAQPCMRLRSVVRQRRSWLRLSMWSRQPIYVVNQGPVFAGPDVTVVPACASTGRLEPYPYIGPGGGFDRYAVRRPYYRPRGTATIARITHRPRPLPPK